MRLPPPRAALLHEYSAVTKLFVGNLPFTATDEMVRALFSEHGTATAMAARVVTDSATEQRRRGRLWRGAER